MSRSWYQDLKVLIVDAQFHADNAVGRALGAIAEALGTRGIGVEAALNTRDGWTAFVSDADVGCLIVDWDATSGSGGDDSPAAALIADIRARNENVPIFVASERLDVDQIPLAVLRAKIGFLWKTEDTPDFMAGRIEEALRAYADTLLPPFFKALVEYADEDKYAWHTPGHMGGVAFLKSPAGRRFFDFFGENVLRADLSISVPELGSLLPHSGVVGEAERNAAGAFGADRTFFVTNGTSTSNKIVWHGQVVEGDVVVVDRNCHKSIEHALIMTGAVPVYLTPTRNRYGIIGPIPKEQFAADAIAEKIRDCALVAGAGPDTARLAVLTNSTYDGICYHVTEILRGMAGQVDTVHFDEAWFAYAAFHPIYDGRYGMHDHGAGDYPAIFATQSTHKLLAALSQASMVHLRDRHLPPDRRIDQDRFNEAFMMHTSTSPQYGIIASLDVAARMMQHGGGTVMTQDTIDEAIDFRREMARIRHRLESEGEEGGGDAAWWFRVFQPDGLADPATADPSPAHRPDFWQINDGDAWHGYDAVGDGFAMLDPIKVTILTPGIGADGTLGNWGMPAAIVSRFLWRRGIVVEKTGTYSFLVLFSIAVTKGKSGSLVAELFTLKELYDAGAPVKDVFPDLADQYPDRYGAATLPDLCAEMHGFYKQRDVIDIIHDVYAVLPRQDMTPAQAYRRLVKGEVESLPLEQLDGRTNAVGIVPYPPGIPVIMPGERFDRSHTPRIFEYLEMLQDFDALFPGFEHEIHGVEMKPDPETGQGRYVLDCLA